MLIERHHLGTPRRVSISRCLFHRTTRVRVGKKQQVRICEPRSINKKRNPRQDTWKPDTQTYEVYDRFLFFPRVMSSIQLPPSSHMFFCLQKVTVRFEDVGLITQLGTLNVSATLILFNSFSSVVAKNDKI